MPENLDDDVPVPAPEPTWEEAAPVVPNPHVTRFEELPAPASGLMRTPPHSDEAEKIVLGCMLLDGNESVVAAQDLPSAVFYSLAHRQVFATILTVFKRDGAVDVGTLAEELRATDLLAAVGGFPFLMGLTTEAPTTALFRPMLKRLRELHGLRETIRLASSAVERAYQVNGEAPEFLAELSTNFTRLAEGQDRAVLTTPFSVWQPAAFRAYQPPPNLNILAGGYLRRRQLTTLIGPPGVGKSRLSLWLACLHITGREFFGLETQNGPAKWLFFGNENDPSRQKQDLEWFYRSLTAEEQAKVDANLYLHVIDQPDDGIITLADPDACAKLHATLAAVKPDVVVFDPWGSMIEGNENDNEEVRRTLKILLRAIATNCPDAADMVIHHARTGKSTAIEAGNNYSGGSLGRGSKALVSSARCELALWPGHSEDSSRLVLTCEKVNNVQKFEPKGIIFENGAYRTDPDFDLQAWRDDIEGTRGGKTLTIRDLVEMVRAGIHASSDLVAKAEEEFGVSARTVKTRLSDACTKGYLMRTQPVGSYTLGNVKLAP